MRSRACCRAWDSAAWCWGFAFTLVLAVAALAVSMLLKKRSYADEAGAPEGGAAPAHGETPASAPQA